MDITKEESPDSALNICRLCFRDNGDSADNKFVEIDVFMGIFSTFSSTKMIPQGEDIPTQVCSSCKDQLNAAAELQKRINFTESLWTRFMGKLNGVPETAEGPIELDHSNLLWNCHVCSSEFDYPALLNHIEGVHWPQNHLLECRFCESILNKQAGEDFDPLEDATSPWGRNRSFACKLCPKRYTRKEKLHQHLRSHHQITLKLLKHNKTRGSYVCTCGLKYKSSTRFYNHMRTHDENPFKCSACNKGFKSRVLQRDHEIECLQLQLLGGTHQPITTANGGPSLVLLKPTLPAQPSEEYTSIVNQIEEILPEPEEEEKNLEEMEYAEDNQLKTVVPDVRPYACQICSDVAYTSKIRLRAHLKERHKIILNYNYIPNQVPKECSCGRIYTSRTGYDRHLRAHDRTPFRCEICDEGFFNRIGKMDHELICFPLSQAASDGTIPCLVCRQYFPDIKAVKEHKEEMHPPTEETSKIEETEENDLADNVKPTRSKAKPRKKPFPCIPCNISFATELKLAKHTLKSHPLPRPTCSAFCCPHCDKKYSSHQGFDSHIRTHSRLPFSCSACGEGFRNRGGKRDHEQTVCLGLMCVDKDKYQCMNCNDIFPNITELQAHRDQVHFTAGQELPHDCPVCGSRFKLPLELFQHMEESHESAFQCSRCLNRYATLKQLKLHFRNHKSDLDSLICSVCGHKLSRADKLLEHMWTHNGFPCNMCPELLPSRVAWKAHRRSHTGEERLKIGIQYRAR